MPRLFIIGSVILSFLIGGMLVGCKKREAVETPLKAPQQEARSDLVKEEPIWFEVTLANGEKEQVKSCEPAVGNGFLVFYCNGVNEATYNPGTWLKFKRSE